jgi:SAM-dependent methyltransferase
MSFVKLTKVQLKNQERIEAWLKGVPFRENSRDKHPQVPDLNLEDVLEQFCPPDIRGAGQFYTPLDMASQALSYIAPFDGARILDPCCGIGNLLYPFLPDAGRIHVDAYELERECVEVGRKLFPWAHWRHAIPFDHLDELEGRYDFVVMNPPFGTVRGMVPGENMSQGRAKRSEHIFTELAVRALKSGGQAVMIVPSQGVYRPAFHNLMPKKMAEWFGKRATVVYHDTGLPGEFQFTHINVEALVFERTNYDVPVVLEAEAVVSVPAPVESAPEPEPLVTEALPEPVLLKPAPRPVHTLDTALALIGQPVRWKTGTGRVLNVSANGQTLFVETIWSGKHRLQTVNITDIQPN